MSHAFDILSKSQQEIINKYIDFISHGGVVSYRGNKFKKYVSHKEENLPIIKSNLCLSFVRFIASKCGLDPEKKEDLKSERFQPEIFNPVEIRKNDYIIFAKGLKSSTLHTRAKVLKKFYYWILQDFDENIDEDDDTRFKQLLKLEKNVNSFFDQFPTRNEQSDEEVVIKKEKSFLTREQLIIVKNSLLNNPKSSFPFRDACCWEFCCATGIRPQEVVKVRIEHFELDENGYLKINKYGWGVLRLPANASKLSSSPSHEKYGTPIPSSTVTVINQYLKWMYSQDKNILRGKGLLFRPFLTNLDKPYKRNPALKSISQIRSTLDFLTLKQRRDFELKASRRSMNNLIMGINVILPEKEISRKVQEYAANFQMRHKPKNLSTGELYYLDIITEEQYYKVLEYTIAFPWTFKELEEWEIKNGYKKNSKKLVDEHNTNEVQIMESIPLQLEENKLKERRLTEINTQLNELSSRPKNLSMIQWTSLRNKLLKERDKLIED